MKLSVGKLETNFLCSSSPKQDSQINGYRPPNDCLHLLHRSIYKYLVLPVTSQQENYESRFKLEILVSEQSPTNCTQILTSQYCGFEKIERNRLHQLMLRNLFSAQRHMYSRLEESWPLTSRGKTLFSSVQFSEFSFEVDIFRTLFSPFENHCKSYIKQ